MFATLNSARIVMDGNSITAGNNYGSDPESTIGKQIIHQLKAEGVLGLTLNEFAVGGQTCAQMINDGSQTIGASLDRSRNNFLIANEGGNDIAFGATPKQAFDNFRNYCLLRKSEGYYVLAWDCLFRSNSPSIYTTADYNQALIDFNRLLQNGWKEFAHGFMDARKAFPHAPLSVYSPGVLDGGFWFPDNIHPSATANGIIASKLIQRLKQIPRK